MPTRYGAYHTHLLRRTFRHDGKVKHETLGNISHLPDHIIDLVRRALKGESLVNPEAAFTCLRRPGVRPHFVARVDAAGYPAPMPR